MLRKLFALSAITLVAGGFQATSTAQAQKKAIYTHDFITATGIVGRYYGSGIRNWLVNCSSSEGGHGGWVWFSHYSYPVYGSSNTPGGWMQFMASTFWSNAGWAFQDARSRGLYVDQRAKNYYEPLGQAIVAAAMYRYHGNRGWTGSGC